MTNEGYLENANHQSTNGEGRVLSSSDVGPSVEILCRFKLMICEVSERTMKPSKTITIVKTIFNIMCCLNCIACSFINLHTRLALDCLDQEKP